MKKIIFVLIVLSCAYCDKMKLIDFTYDINLPRDSNLMKYKWADFPLILPKSNWIVEIYSINGDFEQHPIDTIYKKISDSDFNVLKNGIRTTYWSAKDGVGYLYHRYGFSSKVQISKFTYYFSKNYDTLYTRDASAGSWLSIYPKFDSSMLTN